MNPKLSNHIQKLKEALLELKPTGQDGFEGLISVALRQITGVPFRLAGSGIQHGVDGQPSFDTDAIAFEGKRYDGEIHRNELITKIVDVAEKDMEIDIWVLGASSMLKSQLAEHIRSVGLKHGIFVLILDWSETDIPPMAAALAMGRDQVEEFLDKHLGRKWKVKKLAIDALRAIRKSLDFMPLADRIRSECNAPEIALALARKANLTWLKKSFSDRNLARINLGQPLSPGDTNLIVWRRAKPIKALGKVYNDVPDGMVTFVLGDEGYGKSWAVAQSWLELEHKPLAVFLHPDEFVELAGHNNESDILLNAIIKQTDEELTESVRRRWQRRFRQWKNRDKAVGPTAVVVLDGINQRPNIRWARLIERLNNEVFEMGGRLIVTSRTPYFQNHVRPALTKQFLEIAVPEWSDHERDEILKANDLNADELNATVAKTLCNPRLLGIAIELFKKSRLDSLVELSISRLLFEHIQLSERDSFTPDTALQFEVKLRTHAKEVLDRVSSQQRDDIKVFESDLRAAADGRFFRTLPDDPTKYEIDEDGLSLALGFAIVDRLRKAHRNGRDLNDELLATLEPISALDATAAAVMAALVISVEDESDQTEIVSALVVGFAGLQNPDELMFNAFSCVAKYKPSAFMAAAYSLILADGYEPNFDWIEAALNDASEDIDAWPSLATHIRTWLSAYTLSPDRGLLSHPSRDPEEKVTQEREEKRIRIESKTRNLSNPELKIFDRLHELDGDLSKLSQFAFRLLAGKELASFTEELLNWAFSNALNTDHWAPFEEFHNLLSLNLNDWKNTRDALQEAVSNLRGEPISLTGKWAMVYLLRATGSPTDSIEAHKYYEELTKDREKFKNWRRVENYCATDPCDPASERPDNIDATAENYANIDASIIRAGLGMTFEDHFFSDARPGMARFAPKTAINKHLEFFQNVLNRSGGALKYGLFGLKEHSALLEKEDAVHILNIQDGLNTKSDENDQEAWVMKQYPLLLSFPLLSAVEQSEFLFKNYAEDKTLLSLIDVAKPLEPYDLERLLEKSIREADDNFVGMVLEIAALGSSNLTQKSVSIVKNIFLNGSKQLIVHAIGLIARKPEPELLKLISNSNWTADHAGSERGLEVWYGSVALLKAAKSGLLDHGEAVSRISPRLYGRAIMMLNADAVQDIGRRLDASIKRAAGLDVDMIVPDIEVNDAVHGLDAPTLIRIGDKPEASDDFASAMKQLTESSNDFQERQKRNFDAFIEFESNLTRASALLVLDNLVLNQIDYLVKGNEKLAEDWYEMFMALPKPNLISVHNIMLLLAHALVQFDLDKAVALYSRAQESDTMVRITFGNSAVTLDAEAVWAGDSNTPLDKLRFDRLDRSDTDFDLAQEVLAAHRNSQQPLLRTYIEERIDADEPAKVARALMVAGFSDQSEFNEDIINRFENHSGMIRKAVDAARYAYHRNVWARHWFTKMCAEEDAREYWRYSVLFTKIVDGRFDIWHQNVLRTTEPIKLFESSIKDCIRNRIKRWQELRKKNLFGQKAPDPIFLQQ